MRIAYVALAALASLALVGCLGLDRPPLDKRRFLLEATRPKTETANAQGHLAVAAFRMLAPWAGAGFVHRRAGGAVEADPLAEFFVPPSTLLADLARRWLADGGLFASVGSEASRAPLTHWLEADVLELSVDARTPDAPAAVLEVEFVLLDDRRAVVGNGRVRHAATLTNLAPETIVSGWNESVGAVLAAMESKLRSDLGR